MQAEAVRIGAQGWRGGFATSRDRLQAQHLLPGAWPKGNAVGAGARLQGHERLIGLDAGQVAYALLFNEDALTSQQPHQTRDDLGE